MDTRTVKVGGREWTLAELNRCQGMKLLEDMVSAGKLFLEESKRVEGQRQVNALRMTSILWSLNNAVKWPDTDCRYGSETEPFCEADMEAAFPMKSYGDCLNKLYDAVLDLNGLMKAQPGERQAEMSESPGAVSAAA